MVALTCLGSKMKFFNVDIQHVNTVMLKVILQFV
jgi:hypothetical protein